ncbi:MAG: hypothetical protein ACI3XJ_05625 [Oscillospiraceae bacterium]
MVNYKELYIQLFAAAADAVEAIEKMNFGRAREILIRAQQNAEEKHLDDQPAGKTCDFLEKI